MIRHMQTMHRGALAVGVFALLTGGALGLGARAISAPQQIRALAGAFKPGAALARLPDNAAPAALAPSQQRAPRPAALLPAQMPAPAAAPPTLKTTALTIKSGQTLMGVLVDAGVPRLDAYNAIQAMKAKLDPRRIKAGQDVRLSLRIKPAPAPILANMTTSADAALFTPQLVRFAIDTDVDRHLEINRQSNNHFTVKEIVTPLEEKFVRVKGVIENSLFLTAQELNIPPAVIIDFIRMYSYDVDFQREIRKGDSFELYYSRFFNQDGKAVKDGSILYGNLVLRGKNNAYYSFKTPDDHVTDYYDEKGVSAKKFLMRTPVDGARISSGFGRRKHPILGYTKKHKGVDFAAPRGTPIMAAGNGIIERANRFGTYGNYVKIRHANGYETAYAHMKGFAARIRKGVRVKQGQIIGYIGTTGRSTGPHLHYEVLINNRPVNPMTIRVPTGRRLKGKMYDAFTAWREQLDARMARVPLNPPLLAAADVSQTPGNATN